MERRASTATATAYRVEVDVENYSGLVVEISLRSSGQEFKSAAASEGSAVPELETCLSASARRLATVRAIIRGGPIMGEFFGLARIQVSPVP